MSKNLQQNTKEFKNYIMEVVAKEYAQNVQSIKDELPYSEGSEPELDERLARTKRDYSNTVAVLDKVFDYINAYDEKFEELSRQNQEILAILKSMKGVD